jgi:hypothetical protein
MRHPLPTVVNPRECSWLARLAVTAALVWTATDTWAQVPLGRSPVPGAPAGVTAFVDVNVVPMDAERVLAKQTVLVEGGRITALGPTDQVEVPLGATKIDGKGQYLIPGLADCHAHLSQWIRDSAKAVEEAELRLFLSGRVHLDHGAANSARLARMGHAVRTDDVLAPPRRAACGGGPNEGAARYPGADRGPADVVRGALDGALHRGAEAHRFAEVERARGHGRPPAGPALAGPVAGPASPSADAGAARGL